MLILMLLAASEGFSQKSPNTPKNNEVIYHMFQRSFYDSNGDSHGDFNGIKEKLDYLQDLGITAIMLVPVVESPYYHNYFSNDFEKIDPKYGTRQDFINLTREIHRRGMKLYLDMETQYVTEDHIWYKDSYNNPKSAYSDYIIYNGPDNTKPESIIFGITELKGYDGTVKKITTVNLYSKKVQDYNFKLFKSFVDPNGDGNFSDGVDGFRLDHMQDDLDGKKILTNLFDKFWSPLISKLKQVNPKLNFVAEQANWNSYGFEYFGKGHVDRVFGFRLQRAIASFDKNKLIRAADSTLNRTPSANQQVVFLENHDMPRFSTLVKQDPGKLKVGAALNLFIGGIPSIYYGQELGMVGGGGFSKFGITDGNDIPQREAFEWYKSDEGKGMALWYKGTGPWWDQTNLKPNDGISLEEEKADPNSLYNFYKLLLHIRKLHTALITGKFKNLKNDNKYAFSFLRYDNSKAAVVVVNLSDEEQTVNITGEGNNFGTGSGMKTLYGQSNLNMASGQLSGKLSPYAIEVLEVK
jgi:alpha-amylase